MKLTELGLDSDLAAQAQCAVGLRLARVTAVDRNRYVMRNEQGEVSAEHDATLIAPYISAIRDKPRFLLHV